MIHGYGYEVKGCVKLLMAVCGVGQSIKKILSLATKFEWSNVLYGCFVLGFLIMELFFFFFCVIQLAFPDW